MADLDEMSAMIGEIRSDVRHALKRLDAHEDRVEERFEKLTQRIDVNNGYRFRIEALEDTVESHKPVIESYSRLKWVWGLACVAIGFVATLAVKWFA